MHFSSLSATGCDTKSIFKRSKAGLNSEFVFSCRLVSVPKLNSPDYATIYQWLMERTD